MAMSLASIDGAYAQQVDTAGLRIERSAVAGLATFVTPANGGAIPVPAAGVAGGNGRPQPADFLGTYGALFGVRNANAELIQTNASRDDLAHTHTSYRQVYHGVSVFGGVLRVHQDATGDVIAANGHFFPIPDTLNVTPTLAPDDAVPHAQARLTAGNPVVERVELTIVDPGWYGDPTGGVHLAYHIILTDRSAGVREAFFVDAHTGRVLDQWNLMETARNRVVTDDRTHLVVRSEGGLATGDFDADAAYDYAGDVYGYLFRAFGRDSIDGFGATLWATVHLQSTSCPNAFGGGGATWFCDGIVTDDVVAHEFTHSLTEFTANLIYQNQSGQLNESFSDVIGEVVDLLNGDASSPGAPGGTPWPTHGTGPGTDTPNDLRTGCVASAFMTVNSPMNIAGDYSVQPASFGPSLTPTGISGNVAVADPVRACDVDLPFTNAGSLSGKVVLMDRGTCFFTEKVKNAQDAGAIAALVANNLPVGPAPMGGGDPTITIPSVGITQADGAMIKSAVESGTVNVTLRSNTTPEVRWLVGEDSTGFGGAIRDMWLPSCFFNPDTANDPYQSCDPNDNGGVHSGSGVPNHAFAMLTDGTTFNSITINGIGLFKAAAVWYRALTVYLTPTSDFRDAYAAFNQAATDLVGAMIRDPRDGSNFGVFTAADAVEVDHALRAVEMNTRGLCGANIDPPGVIIWEPATNPTPWPNTNHEAMTRSLKFRVIVPVAASSLPGQDAIKVTMVDLQHPDPPNEHGRGVDFTTFDTAINGSCSGGWNPGTYCDSDADCRTCRGYQKRCTSDAECGIFGVCPPGGTCSNMVGCTAAGEANGCARWVGNPGTFLESQDSPILGSYRAARLQCTPFYYDWITETTGGPITVVGAEILPSSTYSVQAYASSCAGNEGTCTNVSAAVTMYTRRSGDVELDYNPPGTSGQPNVIDVAQLVAKFKNTTGAPVKARAQIQPNLPELNGDISALDISDVVDAVKGYAYPFSGPCPCPSAVVCGATACPSGVGTCVTAYGPGAMCVKTCSGGANDGQPCVDNNAVHNHCPGGTCGSPMCRDRCGRCTP